MIEDTPSEQAKRRFAVELVKSPDGLCAIDDRTIKLFRGYIFTARFSLMKSEAVKLRDFLQWLIENWEET